jgi:hypothetical protein
VACSQSIIAENETMAYASAVEVMKANGDAKAPHGQSSGASSPTAKLSTMSASVALTLVLPSGSHTQGASQTSKPTATFRMNKASVALGIAPSLVG